ncbi:MAG: hypothetical protein K5683_00590 [Prevotella sp.]|nr:hypothetical protein [Prevotella sp.]
MNENIWTENIILADADYVDSVAFNLIVNFERMLGRRIPQADMARWAECMALDGGMKEGDHETLVVLIHDQRNKGMQNFTPGLYEEELKEKAFKGRLGEFTFHAVQTEEMISKADLLLDTLHMIGQQKEVKRLMIAIPEQLMDEVRKILRQIDNDERRTTIFTMQPTQGGAFRQELLGYSLMAALGISGKEIDEKLNK